MSSDRIILNQVSFTHQQMVLTDCSITLPWTGITALIGENGVGKTTLLNIIAGYSQPDSGKITRHTTQAHWLGYLTDKPPLYPDWRVSEFLIRSARLMGIPIERCHLMKEQLSLDTVWHTRCKSLSHGYAQRVAMAQMLLSRPEVLLLDEPNNGLDHRARLALRPLLKQLADTTSILLVSHDYHEICALADKCYLLNQGKCYTIPSFDTPTTLENAIYALS